MIEFNEPNKADKKAVRVIAKGVSKYIVGQVKEALEKENGCKINPHPKN